MEELNRYLESLELKKVITSHPTLRLTLLKFLFHRFVRCTFDISILM